MHYILDGYNLLFRMANSSKELQTQRTELIEEIAKKIEIVSLEASLVFDGASHHEALSRTHFRFLEIIYTSSGESADEYIVNHLEEERSAGQVVVVTSDRGLAEKCKNRRAKVIRSEEFLHWLSRKASKKKKRKEPERPPLKLNTINERYLRQFEEAVEESAPRLKQKRYQTENERWLELFESESLDEQASTD